MGFRCVCKGMRLGLITGARPGRMNRTTLPFSIHSEIVPAAPASSVRYLTNCRPGLPPRTADAIIFFQGHLYDLGAANVKFRIDSELIFRGK